MPFTKLNFYTSFLLILGLLAFGCESSTNSKSQQEAPKAEKKEKPKRDLLKVVLNKNNAVEILKEFGQTNPETLVLLHTDMGKIKIRLYEETPLHRANFLMLAKRDYYDETLFYRIIKNFMIQGGDSDELKFRSKKRKIGKYKIPAEIRPNKYFHKRGAVAMARDYENNPNKLSSVYDFYIVQGQVLNMAELQAIADENGQNFIATQKQVYTTLGGTPHLDGEHTVFGEVVEGMEVVDKIANVEVGQGDWPLKNIMIQDVEVLEQK